MRKFLIHLALLLLLPSSSFAESQAEMVTFAPGSTTAEFSGTVEGYETKEYQFKAQAGQILQLKATSADAKSLVMEVRRAGILSVELFDNSKSHDMKADIEIPTTHDYVVRMSLKQSDQESGKKASFQVSLTLPPVKSMMVEAKYLVDQESRGIGQYVVVDTDEAKPIEKLRVQLEKSGAAHIQVALKDQTFVLVGTWEAHGAGAVNLTINSGFGGRKMQGEGTIILASRGGFETIDVDFAPFDTKEERSVTFKTVDP